MVETTLSLGILALVTLLGLIVSAEVAGHAKTYGRSPATWFALTFATSLLGVAAYLLLWSPFKWAMLVLATGAVGALAYYVTRDPDAEPQRPEETPSQSTAETDAGTTTRAERRQHEQAQQRKHDGPQCWNCSVAVDPETDYCSNCGARLEATRE